ncbi:N-acetylmuramoyl-L-alanine amidase [Conchiformibius steedae]|uniref:N-acetylmuramoyl-L-alanine amidase family protein n=1 Tax=Conchiformibius steedae TaxID=153493 RepID=UPI0026F08429|nr:N-acetylmuramoyl-L-alanine amidase [Conchiformibius steedae]
MKQWFKRAACAAALALHLGSAAAADIVIDAGHGGKDPGAIGSLGKHDFMEKDIALDMSLHLGKQLKKQGFSVAMTRKDDTFRPLKQRLAYARKHCRKLFASVHVNAAKHARAQGVQVYVSRQADKTAVGKKSLQIAQNVQQAFNPKKPAVRRAGFMMLKNTNCPTLQLEMYYMSNKADLKKLSDKRQRRVIAERLAKVLGKSLRAKGFKTSFKPTAETAVKKPAAQTIKRSRVKNTVKTQPKAKPAPKARHSVKKAKGKTRAVARIKKRSRSKR